jgi:nickel-dependent lactate racemase
MVLQRVKEEGYLSDRELSEFVAEALSGEDVDGKRVLCIMPDGTRSMPMPAMFRALCGALRGRVAKLDYLIALGTHPPMSDSAINRFLGITPQERSDKFADVGIFNHEWQNPDALTCVGTLTEDEIAQISGGLMRRSADVLVNKRVLESDLICIVGPVFPHEVVGISGGNKYFFPGVAGAEIVDLSHWLGALITTSVVIGVKDTSVRGVIDRASALIKREKRCFCLNVMGKDCEGIFYGTPEDAWSAAADLVAKTHIVYKERPYKSVLALAPPMYDELWVAGKCMYKLERVVADGGELIIYAPHISGVSLTHGRLIRQVGYHTRDYFLAQTEKYKDIPEVVRAHCTQVRGIGKYEDGVEECRIRVTLATQIPEDECLAINLDYRDPASINPDEWRNREDEGLLLVPDAGEVLYRLTEGNAGPSP